MIAKNSELVKHVVNLIDKQAFMNNHQIEIWTQIKSELTCMSFDKVRNMGEIVSALDRELCKLGDPHTRIFNNCKHRIINPVPLQWIQCKLYIIGQEVKEVTHLNGITVKDILEIYENDYPAMRKQVILNQILQDIKLGANIFNKPELSVRDNQNENLYCFKEIDTIRKENYNILKEKFAGVIIHRVDSDTVLVKIMSFYMLDLENIFLEKMRNISDDIKNVIFDIRDNSGGNIQVAKRIVSYIIRNDVEYDYDIRISPEIFIENHVSSRQLDVLKNKKIVVFVNLNTMSASEYIFLKAIKIDNPNSIIIGEETFGLSGQASVNELSDDIVLYITEKRYYNKSHSEEITCGILPDYYISPKCFHGSDWYLEWFEENKEEIIIT